MDGDGDGDPHWNTGLNSLGPNEIRWKENVSKKRQDQREPSSDDGWQYRWRPTLEHRTEPPQGPNEEQKEEEHEKGNQDREGCDHPLIQGD